MTQYNVAWMRHGVYLEDVTADWRNSKLDCVIIAFADAGAGSRTRLYAHTDRARGSRSEAARRRAARNHPSPN